RRGDRGRRPLRHAGGDRLCAHARTAGRRARAGLAGRGHAARADARRGSRAGFDSRGLSCRVALAEAAGLLAVAADLHRAPGAGAVARLVVEGDAAVFVAAALQPFPFVGRRKLGDGRDDASDRAARSVALGCEDGTTDLEADTEVRLATG